VTPALQPLPWQQSRWLELTAQVLSGNLHHAVLLSGPKGVGKRHFAGALAAFILCENRSGYACGQCASCLQLAAGTHADASSITVDGHLGLCLGERPEQSLSHWVPDKDSRRRDIGIEAVRSLIGQVALASHRGRGRVIVVEPAEKLNASSVNALLKTLEEPPSGVIFLLLSEQPALLRPTFRSRCRALAFARPPGAVAAQWLRDMGVQDTEALLNAAYGAPLRALDWHRDQREHQHALWRESLARLAQRRESPLTVAADIGKADAGAYLAWLTGWMAGEMRSAAAQGSALLPALARLAPLVAESQRRIEGNAKPELVVEALLIQWWSLHRPRKPVPG
jgi:DNA polymerase III subunit delta'